MSYTLFETALQAPATLAAKYFDDDLTLHALSKKVGTTVTVSTTNAGDRAGDHVVLLFAAPPGVLQNTALSITESLRACCMGVTNASYD